MKEVYHISGSGNNSGLKIFESDGETFVIKVPKTLVSKSWRYLILGIFLLSGSIVIPIFVNMYIGHFWIKLAFFGMSLTLLVLGGGFTSIAIWEIRSAIEISVNEQEFTIFHPAFLRYRSLTRKIPLTDIKKLYVNKVKRIGKEKYSLMLQHQEPLDERLIKGFYVPEQALWIAEKINTRLAR